MSYVMIAVFVCWFGVSLGFKLARIAKEEMAKENK